MSAVLALRKLFFGVPVVLGAVVLGIEGWVRDCIGLGTYMKFLGSVRSSLDESDLYSRPSTLRTLRHSPPKNNTRGVNSRCIFHELQRRSNRLSSKYLQEAPAPSVVNSIQLQSCSLCQFPSVGFQLLL